MSDTTTLSHEYETSASFAESVNQAVLHLKKARRGRSSASAEEVRAARTTLAGMLEAVAASVGSPSTAGHGVNVPGEVLDRLVAKNSNRLSYFQDDLVEAAKALKKSVETSDETLEILEEIADAADATASASFRRLRRR